MYICAISLNFNAMFTKNQAFLYKANGEIIPILPNNGASFTLKEIKNFLKGAFQMLSLNDQRIMIVAKERGIQPNDCATNLAKGSNLPVENISGDVLVTPYSLLNS